ncbi:MAG: hypothetical protein COU47_00005 [Candidatus Niyogibacteria bacterium CG10_big_fil_rev_8_21_14_0_10_46_36]|uniref:Beta-lactamase class A catalytic domain-containing protein n=1 Tax=Candidatus Niyogibacteria bacterium CG10_big_fil_rev_8_21_14_0_10_46_36 TaxID=1974726 RepID=A0A2H0TE29_9BACT|nr:MAG: hypothetical protein COU47_00005 [Candidatus Niyogibacteria bacterium CG10_big_fil_rev_8_21_14_0_10_46_36]
MQPPRKKDPHIKWIAFLILLNFALLSIVGGIFFFWESYTQEKLSDILSAYPFVSPARNLIDQKDFITNLVPLREDIKKIVDSFESVATTSIYIEALNSGASITLQKDVRVFPASLAKIPLAMAVIKNIEEGGWAFDTMLPVEEKHIDSRSGTLYERVRDGDGITVKQLLEEMLVHSDNTAYETLLSHMKERDWSNISDLIGLAALYDFEGKILLAEYIKMFRSLYTASYLTRESSEYILELLSLTGFNNFIVQGLPSYQSFSHKWGKNIERNVFADVGIVYLPDRPFLIGILVQSYEDTPEAGEKTAQTIMKAVAERTYSYMRDY